MPQRLDDVTGDPIRLSARQREAQREQTIIQINQIILQLHAVTQQMRQQMKQIEAHEIAIRVIQDQHARWRASWRAGWRVLWVRATAWVNRHV